MHHHPKEIHPLSGQTIYYSGPDLSEGPLPALFYFCTSGYDSLALDPFNQPVLYLLQYPVRVFSMTLPFHGPGFNHKTAVGRWAEALAQGQDPLSPFIEQVLQNIDYLQQQNAIASRSLAVAGLSRGGFVAAHLAARSPYIDTIAAFAPLTDLFYLDEFRSMRDNELVSNMNPASLIDRLVGKTLRFYIGNRDTRVGTDACYAFIRQLVETSYANRLRSPLVELVISPSIGHQGHGTAKHTFHEGARWLLTAMDVIRNNNEEGLL